MSAKPMKHNKKAEKAAYVAKNEKIINDLLLQFAYTLTICVITIFVFNATCDYKYGQGVYDFTRGTTWAFFGISAVCGIIFAILRKTKGKGIYKTLSIYSFITMFVMFWYVGAEKIPYYLQGSLPFLQNFAGTYKIVFAMFPMLGVAAVIEFIVYFVRYYRLNGKKKK